MSDARIWTTDDRVACPACRNEMNPSATTCPSCGHTIGAPIIPPAHPKPPATATASQPKPRATSAPSPAAPSSEALAVIEKLAKAKLISAEKYGSDPEYASSIDRVLAQLAAVGGDLEVGFRCFMAGSQAGSSALGVEVFEIMTRTTAAPWSEFDALRDRLRGIKGRLPVHSQLAKVTGTLSEQLRDRTPTLLFWHACFGVVGSAIMGVIVGWLGFRLKVMTPIQTKLLNAGDLADLLGLLFGLALAYPFAIANRLAPTVRRPRVNPKYWWSILPLAVLLYGAFQVTEYATISSLTKKPLAISSFGADMAVTIRTQWLFAIPFAAIAVKLFRSTALLSTADMDEGVSNLDEILSGFGIPGIYWWIMAAVSLVIALLARGFFWVLG